MTRAPVVTHARDATFETGGPRPFLAYRDLGLAPGRFLATVARPSGPTAQATGWHYHEVDLLFLYCLRGWQRIVFADGTEALLEAGSSLEIPSRVVHDEVDFSSDLELLVVSSPSSFTTIQVGEAGDGFARTT